MTRLCHAKGVPAPKSSSAGLAQTSGACARHRDQCCRICFGQVCLAAEECGHLDFDTRADTWWNRDAFHCGGAPAAPVHFYDIFLKVYMPDNTAQNPRCCRKRSCSSACFISLLRAACIPHVFIMGCSVPCSDAAAD